MATDGMSLLLLLRCCLCFVLLYVLCFWLCIGHWSRWQWTWALAARDRALAASLAARDDKQPVGAARPIGLYGPPPDAQSESEPVSEPESELESEPEPPSPQGPAPDARYAQPAAGPGAGAQPVPGGTGARRPGCGLLANRAADPSRQPTQAGAPPCFPGPQERLALPLLAPAGTARPPPR